MTRADLRQLAYFVAAAEVGTMSGAAQRLHVSQSAVSMAVADLERGLGVQLLLRHRARGLTLTAAGRELLPEARSLLARAEDLVAGARDLGGALSGRLVVGCFRTLGPFVLPPLLQAFGAAHPAVRLDFVEDSLEGLQRALLAGDCEAALLYDLGIRPGIETRVVERTWPYVLVAPDHPLAAAPDVPLAALADQDMIMLDVPPSEEYFGGLLRDHGVVPRIRHRTRSVETVRALVARGLGFGMLIQQPVVRSSAEGLPLHHLAVRDPLPPMPVVVATPAGVRPTRRAEAFVEFCESWRAQRTSTGSVSTP